MAAGTARRERREDGEGEELRLQLRLRTEMSDGEIR